MSSISADKISTCANCGKGEENGTKLKTCTACKLVKYCNRECQIAHRPHHKKECKKRAVELHALELHDEKLFKVPPKPEDCPICFIQMPSLSTGSKTVSCCGKTICSGCIYADIMIFESPENRDNYEKMDAPLCPFCRTPSATTEEEDNLRNEKRIEMSDDPVALHNLACSYYCGSGVPQNLQKAIELYSRAGVGGNHAAEHSIGCCFLRGEGVPRDIIKAICFFERAAIGGYTKSRAALGRLEGDLGNKDRALKHHMIAAGFGYTDCLIEIQKLYKNGHATKEDLKNAEKAYQACLDEIKSDQRDKAAAHDSVKYKYY